MRESAKQIDTLETNVVRMQSLEEEMNLLNTKREMRHAQNEQNFAALIDEIEDTTEEILEIQKKFEEDACTYQHKFKTAEANENRKKMDVEKVRAWFRVKSFGLFRGKGLGCAHG